MIIDSMALIIYETPMMVWNRIGNSSETPYPTGAFKKWILQSKKNPEYARTYYLMHRMSFMPNHEAYDDVKKMVEFEKGLNRDLLNIAFTILHEVFGDLW